MRVLHVITGLAAGGAEQQLRDLLRHTRHDAEVVALTNAGVLAGEIRADGVPVTDLAMTGNTDLGALPRLTRLVRAGRYDLVHVHLYRACLYGRLAARLAGVRAVVATEHSLCDGMIEGRRADRAGVRALYLAAERLGRMTVAVSPTVAAQLSAWGVPRRRLTVIPNGIDAAAFAFDPDARDRVRARLGLAPGTPVVGSVGRLAAPKHAERLLEAVAGLDGVTLVLVGDGESRAGLERRARELGIAGRVVFTGESRDVRAMYSAFDVFATASPRETFGLAVLEALAAGLPSVYVRCPAVEDRTDVPGALRVASEPAALRAAIAEGLARRGPRTPAAPPDYDIAAVARRVDELYDSLRPDRAPEVSRHV
jgi:glycosyltransferase involved in cell wall biosynthesis